MQTNIHVIGSSIVDMVSLGTRSVLKCFDENVLEVISRSINCTVNLANAAHYDLNDEGVFIL